MRVNNVYALLLSKFIFFTESSQPKVVSTMRFWGSVKGTWWFESSIASFRFTTNGSRIWKLHSDLSPNKTWVWRFSVKLLSSSHMLSVLSYQLSLLCMSFWDMVLVKRGIVAKIQLVKNYMPHVMLCFQTYFILFYSN